jgi:hypothetical protein
VVSPQAVVVQQARPCRCARRAGRHGVCAEEINKVTFVQGAMTGRDLYQFGLGVAGIVAATR